MNFIQYVERLDHSRSFDPSPFAMFKEIFSPALIISYIITVITSMTYVILGIVFVVQKKDLKGTERAFWIIGFVFFGFIAGIVFMILNKSKGLTKHLNKDLKKSKIEIY